MVLWSRRSVAAVCGGGLGPKPIRNGLAAQRVDDAGRRTMQAGRRARTQGSAVVKLLDLPAAYPMVRLCRRRPTSTIMSALKFSAEDVEQARAALSALRDDVSDYVNSTGILPSPGPGRFASEKHLLAPNPFGLRTRKLMLLEVAGDQLAAIARATHRHDRAMDERTRPP